MKNHIILVDKNLPNMLVIEKILLSIESICIKVDSGITVLTEIAKYDISLIILNVSTSGSDYLDTLSIIKKNNDWENIPVIVFGNKNQSETLQTVYLNNGAVDFVTLPITPELLLVKIKTYLELFSYRSNKNIKITNSSSNLDKLVSERTNQLEYKNKQLRLEEKERKAAIGIINASPIIAFRWKNVEGLPLEYVSENVKEISGYSVKELLSGKISILDIIYKDDKERVNNELINFSKDKIQNTFTHKPYRIHKKNGDIIWVDERIIIIRNKQGYITHFQGIILDITNRKLAEKEMQKLTTAFEQTSSSIVITDIDGNIEYVNPYFCELTGYSESEVIGQNPRVLKSGDTCSFEYMMLWKTITSGKVWQGRFHNVKKNGEKYWESAVIAPVFNDNKEIINYIGLKQDITKQVEIQYKLEESEKQYRSLIQDNYSVMMVIDPTSQRIIVANNACCNFYGYSKEEMLKMHITDINISNKKDIDLRLQNTLSNKQNRFEFKHKLANGKIRDVEVYSGKVKYGEKDALLSIVHDITEKTKISRELIVAKEKAIESDKLKTAFLANMSHEIRTPMNAIIGFSQLLAMSDNTKNEVINYVETITSSGKQLLNLIDDIISISQIEAGIIELYNKTCYPEKILKTVYKIFSLDAVKSGLEFSYNNELSIKNKAIFSDPRRIHQVLINLVTNAFKFTTNGYIKIGCTLKNNNIEFYVSDSGIGITKENQKAVFDRFMQVDHGPNIIYGGTGIGLSISRAVVEKLGGEIWVVENKDKGTEFRFTIPVVEQINKPTITKSIENSIPDLVGKTILIAEDQDTNYELLNILLLKAGAKVLRAKTGVEAINIIKENENIRLIFMDVKMPVIDGLKAATEIRKFNKEVTILAQTAYAQTGDRSKALKAGCNDYIAKPILKNALYALIKKSI